MKKEFYRVSIFLFTDNMKKYIPWKIYPLSRCPQDIVICMYKYHVFQSVNRNLLDKILFSRHFYKMNSNFCLLYVITISFMILQNIRILDSKTESFVNYDTFFFLTHSPRYQKEVSYSLPLLSTILVSMLTLNSMMEKM